MLHPGLSIEIERVSADSAESRQLMAELSADIDQLFGNEEPGSVDFARLDAPGVIFLIARQGISPIGCGAIRPGNSGVAEVKRVYVREAARRQGVAREIMRALERIARETGFNEIWLETGLRQPAAMRLYESLGYRRIAAFGEYKDDPQSVCYGKPLPCGPSTDRRGSAARY